MHTVIASERPTISANTPPATGWFTMAMIAIPLSLLVAAVLGFLIYCSVATNKNDTRGRNRSARRFDYARS